MFRYGVSKRFELRTFHQYFLTKSYIMDKHVGDLNGFDNTQVGFKYVFQPEESGKKVGLATVGYVGIPKSGSKYFTMDKPFVTIKAVASHTVKDKISFCYNANYTYDFNSESSSCFYTFNFGGGVTEKLTLYGEQYGNYDFDSESYEASFDAGALYLLSKNLMVDVYFNVGINHNFYNVGTGVSWRIPH